MAGATMVRDLVAGSLVEGTFAVTRKRKRARKDGRPYLDVELADRSGRVAGRVWEAVPLLEGRFDVGDTVRVLGRVSEYGGRVEMELRDAERVEGGDASEGAPRWSWCPALAGTPRSSTATSTSCAARSTIPTCPAWRGRCWRSPATASASGRPRPPRTPTTPTPAASSSTRSRWPPSAARRRSCTRA